MEVLSSWEDQTGFSCWDVEQRMGDVENPKALSLPSFGPRET